MTEIDLEVQELRRENDRLKAELKKAVKEKNRIKKKLDEVTHLRYLDQAEVIRLRRQVDYLIGTDEG